MAAGRLLLLLLLLLAPPAGPALLAHGRLVAWRGRVLLLLPCTARSPAENGRSFAAMLSLDSAACCCCCRDAKCPGWLLLVMLIMSVPATADASAPPLMC
jgi:hypothetical protein